MIERICTAGTKLWDWFENRRIDQHLVAGWILYISYDITQWAINFYANHPDKSGTDLAVILAAVTVPWSAAQTYALKFWFEGTKKP